MVKQILFFNKHVECPYIFNISRFLMAQAVTLVAQCGNGCCHPYLHWDRGRKQQRRNTKFELLINFSFGEDNENTPSPNKQYFSGQIPSIKFNYLHQVFLLNTEKKGKIFIIVKNLNFFLSTFFFITLFVHAVKAKGRAAH